MTLETLETVQKVGVSLMLMGMATVLVVPLMMVLLVMLAAIRSRITSYLTQRPRKALKHSSS